MVKPIVLALAVVLMSGCATAAPPPAEWKMVDGAWIQEPKVEAPDRPWPLNWKSCAAQTISLERFGCSTLEWWNTWQPSFDALRHMPK